MLTSQRKNWDGNSLLYSNNSDMFMRVQTPLGKIKALRLRGPTPRKPDCMLPEQGIQVSPPAPHWLLLTRPEMFGTPPGLVLPNRPPTHAQTEKHRHTQHFSLFLFQNFSSVSMFLLRKKKVYKSLHSRNYLCPFHIWEHEHSERRDDLCLQTKK